MQIVNAPNPVLSRVAKPVGKIDKNIKKVLEKMKKALLSAKDPEGVGLAAPQIGEGLRIFIAKPDLKGRILVFINPEIINISPLRTTSLKQSKTTEKAKKRSGVGQKLEGCLSLKDIWGTVQRSQALTLSYMDEEGRQYKKNFKGFLATIIQHETDHLNGILFPRRVLEQKGKLYKSSKDEKGEDVFEEIEVGL